MTVSQSIEPSVFCQPVFLFFPKIPAACGDDGARTRDLVVANHALSQLSYIPDQKEKGKRKKDLGNNSSDSPETFFLLFPSYFCLPVRVLGFEPRTSALSELRSSQLSYTRSAQRKQKSQTILVWPYPSTQVSDRALRLLTLANNPVDHEHATREKPKLLQQKRQCRLLGHYRSVESAVN